MINLNIFVQPAVINHFLEIFNSLFKGSLKWKKYCQKYSYGFLGKITSDIINKVIMMEYQKVTGSSIRH